MGTSFPFSASGGRGSVPAIASPLNPCFQSPFSGRKSPGYAPPLHEHACSAVPAIAPHPCENDRLVHIQKPRPTALQQIKYFDIQWHTC